METARELLLRIGVGDFNATMIIPMLMLSPAQTDADGPAQQVLITHLQRVLRAMGATTVPEDGLLEAPTVIELRKITGKNWAAMAWFEIVRAVADAHEEGVRLHPGLAPGRLRTPVPVGSLPVLPSMPGGALGWAAAALGALWLFKKRKSSRA